MMSFHRLFIRDFSKRPDGIKRQPLYSPIGWGRCVFPVFATNDEEAEGCGTGFFIKGLDFGVTAEHLLDIERIVITHGQDHGLELNLSGLPYGLTALLPSQAIMFGTRRISPEYCQTAKRFIFDIVKKDDPLQIDRRRQRFSRRSDVLFLEFENQGIPPDEWRPRISARVPEVGDWVCAVGFPDIQMHQMAQEEPGIQIISATLMVEGREVANC